MKNNIILSLVGTVVVIGLIIGGNAASRFFNVTTLHTQTITPKTGVECVVVITSHSASVDCWKVL